MSKNKKTIKYTLVLHNVDDFDSCLKEEFRSLEYYTVDAGKKGDIEEGRIYITPSSEKTVEWISRLKHYTGNLSENDYKNKSNKAVFILKYKDRFFSLIYGRGSSMLNESSVVRNFGFRTAVNLIAEDKIKGLNSLNIATDYLDIQRQSPNYKSQIDLQIDRQSDIPKSISGKAEKGKKVLTVTGADSLQFSASSEEKIDTLVKEVLDAFGAESYKEKGFEWIDYIQSVREKEKIEALDNSLLKAIKSRDNSVIIAPNKIIDFSEVGGYFLSGMNAWRKESNFYDQIPSELFFEHIISPKQTNDRILSKLKSNSLYYWDIAESRDERISSVYNCILFETVYEDEKYFINNGNWYKVGTDFYTQIVTKVDSIPLTKISNPLPCEKEWNEGEYNQKFAASDTENYILLDKTLFKRDVYGHGGVEPADIFTRKKQFIHVKKGGSSSTLSHLFAQGFVSARLFKNESTFKTFLNESTGVSSWSDSTPFINENDQIEVVFAIIDKRLIQKPSQFLPFFSMVNLSQTYDNISNMGYECSILPIEQKVAILSKQDQKVFDIIQTKMSGPQTKSEILKLLKEEGIEISQLTLGKYLDKFVKKGLLECDGAKSDKKYRLIEEPES